MNRLNRRRFLTASAAALVFAPQLLRAAEARASVDVDARIRGLLLGTALGDALGGPIEFQPRDRVQGLVEPPKVWREGEKLDAAARSATAGRLRLRGYRELRPVPESYGQWNHNSEPGTITDDTRHKLVLLHALHSAERRGRWPIAVKEMAQAYLDWPRSKAVVGRPGYEALAQDWLEEYQLGARWVVGERDMARALPPERMWQSLPTCCGQMILPPLAALYAGRPDEAYRAAYSLAFFDNGIGKDLNAALIAGLAQALVTPLDPANPRVAFEAVIKTMGETDPLRFRKIRWSERAVDRWLNLAFKFARGADGEPARLFATLEKEFAYTTKWEAQVPFVVIFACLDIAGYDPLAALQLSMEWGHDTDSYAQLLGAFIGALYGPELFQQSWRDAVTARLLTDHGTDMEAECRFLSGLGRLGRKKVLVTGP